MVALVNETYRKRGSTTRLERRGTLATILQTAEHGEATIGDGVFRARTISSAAEPEVLNQSAVQATGSAIEALIKPQLMLERATLLEGVADHWWTDGESERRWVESNARAHVTILHPERRVRCSMSLGGARLEMLDLGPLAAAVQALTASEWMTRPSEILDVALEPVVTAELWPALLRMIDGHQEARRQANEGLEIRQGTHPDFSIDGIGQTIQRRSLSEVDGLAAFHNVFRPSYRIRPVRAPFHLESAGLRRASATPKLRVVAVLSGFSTNAGMLGIPVLCTAGSGSFTGTISMTLEEWLERLSVCDNEESEWFPVGAGSHGRRVVVEGIRLQGVSW